MNAEQTLNFFERLENELSTAASRPPRRRPGWTPAGRWTLALAGAIVIGALVLVPVLAVLGGGDSGTRDDAASDALTDTPPSVGTVIKHGSQVRTVVAMGSAPVGGPWQLEAFENARGEPCISLLLHDEGIDHGRGGHATCNANDEAGRFTRIEHYVPNTTGAGPVREIEIYGRVPEGAATVVLKLGRAVKAQATPFDGPPGVRGDFYLFSVPTGLGTGRVSWLDANGDPGGAALSGP